jgi:hypothetical protein
MKKYVTVISFLFVGVLFSYGQDVSSILQKIGRIKNDTSYIWGQGFGSDMDDARNNALEDLLKNISVHVESESDSKYYSSENNNDIQTRNEYTSFIHTYANATLNNVHYEVVTYEPECHIFCWMSKEEIKRLYVDRKNKIDEMLKNVLQAEKRGQIDDALRNYYWALLLTESLQYPNEAYYSFEGTNHLLTAWIPEQMNKIFNDIDVNVLEVDGWNVDLYFSYNDKPVSSLDFTHAIGLIYSDIRSAKDGRGGIEIEPDPLREVYNVKIEFEFEKYVIDEDVKSVMKLLPAKKFPRSNKRVKAKEILELEEQAEILDIENPTNTFTTTSLAGYKMPAPLEDDSVYREILFDIIANLKDGKERDIDNYFTEEGLAIFKRLLSYDVSDSEDMPDFDARMIGIPNFRFCRLGDDVIARGLYMSFKFKRRSFTQDLVFTFNAENKIYNVAFGLGNTANNDILGKVVWPEEVRMALMQFLENYQTAYALKRLDYLESIFDEHAVIIVANEVPRKANIADNGGVVLSDKIIKRTRHNKQSFLKYLEKNFRSKEYINIHFENNEVSKMAVGGELYAIQIKQHYYSSNYSDVGYLMLMLDFNNPDQPLIKVRTWQAEPDPDFGIYGPEHFE